MPDGLILLHPDDNVLVCGAPLSVGQILAIDGRTLVAVDNVQIGHKVARVALSVGDKVLKYGAPIGSVTVGTPAGGHLHLHNVKSDYIATHTRQPVKTGLRS